MDFATFCQQFGVVAPEHERVGDRYYEVGHDLASFTSGEQRKPYAKGLYLGMEGRSFEPSLALLGILSKTSSITATVRDERAEWLFVCGRDLFTDSFTSKQTEGPVLVLNARGENLGLGTIVQGRDGPLLKNVLDRGNYLRHEPAKRRSTAPNKRASRAPGRARQGHRNKRK